MKNIFTTMLTNTENGLKAQVWMPNDNHEIDDAFDSIRVFEEGAPYTVEITKNRCEEITGFIPQNPNPYILNRLARELNNLNREQLACVEGLCKIENSNKIDTEIPFYKLANFIHSTGNGWPIANGVHSAEQLGRFLYENNMLDDEKMEQARSKAAFSHYDDEYFKRLGRVFQNDGSGVFTSLGFMDNCGFVKQVYISDNDFMNTVKNNGGFVLQAQRKVKIIHHPMANSLEEKIPVAAYVRVSSDMEDQLNSFAAQLSHYKSFIAQNPDWEMADIYADEGISGTSAHNRSEFQRMLADCRKGKIKRILVKSISHFCRNTKDCLEAVRELTALGVSVLFEKEGIDTGTMGNELFLAAMSDFAQNESLSIAGNLRKGIRMRMAQGKYVPTAIPLGYRLENRQLLIEPKEAAIVKRIFKDFLSGKGAEKIALTLTSEKIPRKDGETSWSAGSIGYILTNERYTGDMLHQKTYTSDTLPFKRTVNTSELDKYLVSNSHTPIIDRETYDKVQKLIEERKIDAEKRKNNGHPFKGIVICGECGTAYRQKTSGGKSYWVCRRHDKDSSLCKSKRISQQELEALACRCCSKLYIHNNRIIGGMLEQLYTLKRSLSLNNPEAMKINDEIIALTEQSAVFAGLAARGIWDSSIYQEKKAINDREIQRLHSEKSKIGNTYELDGIIEACRHIQACLSEHKWQDDIFSGTLFTQVAEKIIIQVNMNLTIHLKNGLELDESLNTKKR